MENVCQNWSSNPEFFICASRGIERTIGGAVRGLLRAHVMYGQERHVWARALIGMGWRPTSYIRFLNMIFCLYLQFVELYTLVHSHVIIFLTAYANVNSSFAYCRQDIAVYRRVALYV